MKYLNYIIIILTILIATTTLTFADCAPTNYECLCQSNGNIDEDDIVIFSDIVNNPAEHSVNLDGTHLLCFSDEEILVRADEVILGGGNRIVYNAHLSFVAANNLMVGDSVKFVNLEVTGEAVNPIYIYGMDVQIQDSTINTNMIGIKIFGGNNIILTNVTIVDNPDSIQDFETGISGAATVVNTTFRNISNFINFPGFEIDTNLTGKDTDEEDNTIAKTIIGFSPDQECALDPAENGTVEMYISAEPSDEINFSFMSHYMSCSVKPAEDEICLMPNDFEGEVDEDSEECPEEFTKIDEGECIFECNDVNSKLAYTVKFSYTDTNGYSHSFSNALQIGDLPEVWATFAPTLPGEAGQAPNLEGDGGAGGDDGGLDVGGAAANDPDSGLEGQGSAGDDAGNEGGGQVATEGTGEEVIIGVGDSGLEGEDADTGPDSGHGVASTGGPKAGCSIISATSTSLIPILILIPLLAAPVAARVYYKRRKPTKPEHTIDLDF